MRGRVRSPAVCRGEAFSYFAKTLPWSARCSREGYLWNSTDAGYAMVAVAELVLGGTPIVDGVEIPEIVIEIEPPEGNHGNTRSHLRLYDSRFVGGAPNTADFICCRTTSVRWMLAT